MRQSLKNLLLTEGVVLPERWATLRPEQLRPVDFIQLTADLFGEAPAPPPSAGGAVGSKESYESRAIWRKALFGESNNGVGNDE